MKSKTIKAKIVKPTKIWFFGNVSGSHRELPVPEVDIAVFTGNIQRHGGLRIVNDFMSWFNNIKVPYKLFLPGAQDSVIASGQLNAQAFDKLIWIQDKTVNCKGIKIVGTPFTEHKGIENQADQYVIQTGDLEEKLLPIVDSNKEGVDVVVTNDAPYGVLDLKPTFQKGENFKHSGSTQLAMFGALMEPKIHAFGNVTDHKFMNNAGTYKNPETNMVYVNSTCSNEEDKLCHYGVIMTV